MNDSQMKKVQGMLALERLAAVVPSVMYKEGQGVSGAKRCSESCLIVQREAEYFFRNRILMCPYFFKKTM